MTGRGSTVFIVCGVEPGKLMRFMTLAAAYRVGRVPVLFSDTLVSGIGEKPHQPIATRVDLEGPLPGDWLVPVTGLTRKSVVIGERLAVAAAGNGLGAAVVCGRLKAILDGQSLTAATLFNALRSIDDARSESTSCTLVGWLGAVDECRSFHWNSRTPDTIRWDEDFISGSGEQLFRQLAWGRHQRDMPVSSFDDAQHYALMQVASLLLNEITNGATITNLVGGGYDVWIWDGARFRHGAEVSFLFLSIEWLRSRSKTMQDPAPVLITQKQIEECLAVRVVLPPNQVNAKPDRGERVAIIAPLSAVGRKHLFSRPHDQGEAPHFGGRVFVIITGMGPNGPEHWSAGVDHAQASQFRLESDPASGKVRFWLPSEVLDAMAAAAERQFNRQ